MQPFASGSLFVGPAAQLARGLDSLHVSGGAFVHRGSGLLGYQVVVAGAPSLLYGLLAPLLPALVVALLIGIGRPTSRETNESAPLASARQPGDAP
jgi:hypothetical protein